MPIAGHLRVVWKTYLTRRVWIFAALLLVLCALAIVQYRWINQLGEAEKQREKANLDGALSSLETDFDVEITRVFLAFQVPLANRDYTARYKEWLQHAPYPKLIRGVYIAEAQEAGSQPRPVIPGEPAIRSAEWQRGLPALLSPIAAVTIAAPGRGAVTGLQTFVRGSAGAGFGPRSPEIIVDGNPAFVFPVMPGEPGPGTATRFVTRAGETKQFLYQTRVLNVSGASGPAEWAVVVLDAQYITTAFLPGLVKVHFQNALTSDYETLIVSSSESVSSRIAFPAESARYENRFVDPDGKIKLFGLRLDCFAPAFPSKTISVEGDPRNVRVPPDDSISEVLARKPMTCSGSARQSGTDAEGLWEVLVRHREGSLDQAMMTFRRRNLALSGSVLAVLALGISMLVVLTERARALAEMQAGFVLGVSHELRTPLTVVRLAADNLKKGMVENAKQAHTYGEIIYAHAAELSNMVEAALDLARTGSARLIHGRAVVWPEQIVKNALRENESALRNAKMEVELDVAKAIPAIEVDVRLVQRCVENLIQNAVKYGAAGRWVAIRARTASRAEGERVSISVENRGPGISPVDLPHIFEPFYRGKNGEVFQVPGIGLGLTLVKRVVEAHGGSVEVESFDVTRFSIFLPCHRAPSEAAKAI